MLGRIAEVVTVKTTDLERMDAHSKRNNSQLHSTAILQYTRLSPRAIQNCANHIKHTLLLVQSVSSATKGVDGTPRPINTNGTYDTPQT